MHLITTIVVNLFIIFHVGSASTNLNECIDGELQGSGECFCKPEYQLTSINDTSTGFQTKCLPLCGTVICGDNAICIHPNVCMCNFGYKYLDVETENKTCVPECKHDNGEGTCREPLIYVCDKGSDSVLCMDGYCKSDNKCVCESHLLQLEIQYEELSGFFCGLMFDEDPCEQYYYTLNVSTTTICAPSKLNASHFRNITTIENDMELSNCTQGCENGECDNGECKCEIGYAAEIDSISGRFSCEIQCDDDCQNGFCIGENECSCNTGYEKNNTIFECFPICEKGCINGKCIAPNTCKCNDGYSATLEIHVCNSNIKQTTPKVTTIYTTEYTTVLDTNLSDTPKISDKFYNKFVFIAIIIGVVILILIFSILILYKRIYSKSFYLNRRNTIPEERPKAESFF